MKAGFTEQRLRKDRARRVIQKALLADERGSTRHGGDTSQKVAEGMTAESGFEWQCPGMGSLPSAASFLPWGWSGPNSKQQ